MRFQRCINSGCGRPYQVNQFGKHIVDGSGKITCPHCGHAVAAADNSVFLSHAMSPEEEARFNRDHPAR